MNVLHEALMTNRIKNFDALDSGSLLSSSPVWAAHRSSRYSKEEEDHRGSSYGEDDDERYKSLNETDDNYLLDNRISVREDLTAAFFQPLQGADSKYRPLILKNIIDLLKRSLQTEEKELIVAHLARIVRYAYEIPFKDVEAAFRELLEQIKNDGKLTPPAPATKPSAFIKEDLFPLPDDTNSPVYRLFVEIFSYSGRVSHLSRLLSLHPSFFGAYLSTYNMIMRYAGPLPLPWRNYLAILASARYQCHWLVSLQEEEFLLNDGDISWLKGIDAVPVKLANFMELLQLLLHRPWLISKNHISALVRGNDSWSIGELVHAMTIVTTFKALAGVILGFGVTPEVDFVDFHKLDEEDIETHISESPSTVDGNKNKILGLLKEGYTPTEEPQEQSFVNAETLGMETKNVSTEQLTRFIGKFNLQHEDFDVKARGYATFRVQDYRWKEHGYELFRRFLPEIAPTLDEEFDHIYNMTYKSMSGNNDVDTFPLRRACWQYVQRIKGMFHDDYDYQEVNVFLNRETKTFIKKVTCYPETLTQADYIKCGYEFQPDEKVHLALLAVESSRQSELLYGLHAVMRHMHNRESKNMQ